MHSGLHSGDSFRIFVSPNFSNVSSWVPLGSPWSYHHTGPRSLEVAINQAVEDSVNGKTAPNDLQGLVSYPPPHRRIVDWLIWFGSTFEFLYFWPETMFKSSNLEHKEKKETHVEKPKKKTDSLSFWDRRFLQYSLGTTRFFEETTTQKNADFSYHPPLHHSGKSQLNSGSTAKLARPKPSTPSNSKVIKGSWLLASSSGVSQKWWYLRSTPRAPGCQSQMKV